MILVIAPAALAELHDATQFYVSIGGAQLGSSFIAEFERTANLILGNAGLGSPVWGALRRIPLRRFPYSLIYDIGADQVRIIALAHQRRRPGYWSKRK